MLTKRKKVKRKAKIELPEDKDKKCAIVWKTGKDEKMKETVEVE